jgi:flavin reductase (DIM6/NTAB) family NADH-FMN oxidoreductase RutF
MQDQEAFRLAFRRLAAGVSVVTALDADGQPVGFTATSLASLSADPPLASFNMAQTASSWRAIEQAEHVIIHIMGARNRAAAHTMSLDWQLRFRGDHWAPGPLGIPQLRNVPAWMLGRIVVRQPVEQAALVVVRIEDGGFGEPDEPLLYHQRQYWRPGEAIE